LEFSQILFVLAGALAGGFVNGLTGFGTGITAMGLWLYAISPMVAASLAIICATVSQLQTLPIIWRSFEWSRVLPYIIPGLLGIPIGTLLLPVIDQRTFKIGVGIFLVAYPTYVSVRKSNTGSRWGGLAADGAIGFGGGMMGGLTGFPGPLLIFWTDIRGLTKEHRRSVLQGFNLTILSERSLPTPHSVCLPRRWDWPPRRPCRGRSLVRGLVQRSTSGLGITGFDR